MFREGPAAQYSQPNPNLPMCHSLGTGLTTDTDARKDVKAFCIVATPLRPSCVKPRAGIKVMVARRVLQLGIARVEKSGA